MLGRLNSPADFHLSVIHCLTWSEAVVRINFYLLAKVTVQVRNLLEHSGPSN